MACFTCRSKRGQCEIQTTQDPIPKESGQARPHRPPTPRLQARRSARPSATGPWSASSPPGPPASASRAIRRKKRPSGSPARSPPRDRVPSRRAPCCRSPARPSTLQGLGPGRPLDPEARALLEPRFGRDLGAVRVHDDAEAAEAARAVEARAFTVGNDVVFSPGQYAPGTPAGQRLLAHELAHMVQPSRPAARPSSRDRPGT